MALTTTKTIRTDIDASTVKAAVKRAGQATDSDDLQDWFDIKQHYLQLRQRGRTVKWYCRFKGKSALLGSAINERGGSGYLSVAAAREEASKVYVNGKPASGTAAAPPEPPSWTWAELDAAYQATLTEIRVTKAGRIKHPSVGTQDDVRLSLCKKPIAAWGPLSINKLNADMVVDAIAEIHRENGHRACSKALTYVKSALNHAMKVRRQSGITHAVSWWKEIVPPDPAGDEIKQIIARKKALTQAKTDFTVQHLGELLVAHEAYCAGRIGKDQISPGVRWGVWWVAFTANRRRTPTVLRREELLFKDPYGQAGWGRAMWGDHEMKGQAEFWLPLPSVVLHVAASSIADWEAIVNRSASPNKVRTAWVFSSVRRVGRNPDNTDVAVNGSSLSHYLADLRAAKKLDKRMPPFTLHLGRSVTGNWLDNAPGMPPVASSLVLAHAAAKQGNGDDIAPTTKRFYLTSQRMDIKAVAMEAWSDAVMAAYVKAGGKPPKPAHG
jgi:hypothetical protein